MKNLTTFERYFDANDDFAKQPTYVINYEFGKPKSITCLQCDMTSYNPNDISHKYCANCDMFHDDNLLEVSDKDKETFEEEEEVIAHPLSGEKIFIDSEPQQHSKHNTLDDAYTGYEKALKSFSHNNVKVDQAKGDVDGDDFKGFFADIEIQLSNGVIIHYQHDIDGVGTFVAKTKKGTEIYSTDIDLNSLENGYSNVLVALLISVLDFKF